MKKQCLSPLLFLAATLAAVLAGFPVCCVAANLRSASASSEDATTIADTDLVGTRAYLVVQVEGFGMEDLARISPKKRSILDCAFHKSFDEIHGDRDGLYLSGQQIVATDEEAPEDTTDVELDKHKYVYRPRKFPSKPRPKPRYPPPRPPPRQYPIEKKWNIYWYIDSSGRCNLCPDDDSMETSSLLLNTNNNKDNEKLALADKKARDQDIASEYVMSEDSVNAIADTMRKNLIQGSCVNSGDNDDSFEYVQNTDVFVLSQSDFEDSVAAIAAFKEARSGAETNSATTADLQDSHSANSLLPFYYGGSSFAPGMDAAVSSNRFFKIGLSGVDCGPWNKEALLDVNSGLHDSINSMGVTDKGHVIDKIVGGRKQPHSNRRYVWKCHYDVYANLDLEVDVLDDDSLGNIGDALCDDLIQFGGNEKFQNVIDCQLNPLTATEYRAILAADEKAGLPVSSAQE